MSQDPMYLALFAALFAGMLFVIRSRNVMLKRIVLPLTLIAASVLAHAGLSQTSLFAGMPRFVLPLLLWVNAVWVFRSIRNCASCGRTTQAPALSREPVYCSQHNLR